MRHKNKYERKSYRAFAIHHLHMQNRNGKHTFINSRLFNGAALIEAAEDVFACCLLCVCVWWWCCLCVYRSLCVLLKFISNGPKQHSIKKAFTEFVEGPRDAMVDCKFSNVKASGKRGTRRAILHHSVWAEWILFNHSYRALDGFIWLDVVGYKKEEGSDRTAAQAREQEKKGIGCRLHGLNKIHFGSWHLPVCVWV